MSIGTALVGSHPTLWPGTPQVMQPDPGKGEMVRGAPHAPPLYDRPGMARIVKTGESMDATGESQVGWPATGHAAEVISPMTRPTMYATYNAPTPCTVITAGHVRQGLDDGPPLDVSQTWTPHLFWDLSNGRSWQWGYTPNEMLPSNPQLLVVPPGTFKNNVGQPNVNARQPVRFAGLAALFQSAAKIASQGGR